MKKITLVRHAKSSWKFNVIDHERPLNKRGENDAHLVSNWFHKFGIDVDMVFSSDAVRAKTTANIFITNLKIDQNIVSFEHDLYDFSGANLVRFIKSCDDAIDNLMIFGHNHAITAFVNTFGDMAIDNVPTCGVVILHFNIDSWKKLSQGKTIKTVFPKNLK